MGELSLEEMEAGIRDLVRRGGPQTSDYPRLQALYPGGFEMLFDYFDDRLFCRVLRRLMGMVAEGGRMVIGNFSPRNPTRAYMRLFDWELNYRSAERLLELAMECGIPRERLAVGEESEGINLFLHIRFR
jgi:hypothetical protein